MNELTYDERPQIPVHQGVAPTPGAIAKATTGSMLLLAALFLRGRLGLGLAAAGAGLIYTSRRRRHVPQATDYSIDALATITIDASPDELYEHWCHPERLPDVFQHVISVTDHGDGHSTWRVRGPMRKLEWDAVTTVDEPGHRIAWRSLPGGDVHHEGEVVFEPAPGDRGTEVRVHMKYSPPGGKMGALLSGLMGKSPRQSLREDLRRLKQLVECGEIATTHGQPADRSNRAGRAGWLPTYLSDAVDIVRRPLQSQEIR